MSWHNNPKSPEFISRNPRTVAPSFMDGQLEEFLTAFINIPGLSPILACQTTIRSAVWLKAVTRSSMVDVLSRVDSKPSILDLCPEILLTIFSYLSVKELSRAAQVCQLWQEIAYSCYTVWENAVLDSTEFNMDVLPSLLERKIQRVRFLNGGSPLHTIMTYFPKLKGIEVFAVPELTRWFYQQRMHHTASEDMKIYLSFVEELRHVPLLSLKILRLNGVWNTRNEVNSIVQQTPNVESFFLRLTDSELSDSEMVEILASLKNLKSLTLEYCRPVGFHCGSASEYRSDSVKRLCLVKCPTINDNSIRTVSQSFPNLREIHLIACSNISDECFRYLAKMKKLLHVTMNRCINVTKAGRSSFFKTTHLTAYC